MSGLDRDLQARITQALADEPDELRRAEFIRDLNVAAYDAVKKHHAAGGLADTQERSGVGLVLDAARNHWSDTAARAPATAAPTESAVDTWMASIERWKSDPTEEWQKEVTAPQSGDDATVGWTAIQAEKCQAILWAYLDGVTMWKSAVQEVAVLLSSRSLTARGINHATPDPWPSLAQLPWPPPPGLYSRDT